MVRTWSSWVPNTRRLGPENQPFWPVIRSFTLICITADPLKTSTGTRFELEASHTRISRCCEAGGWADIGAGRKLVFACCAQELAMPSDSQSEPQSEPQSSPQRGGRGGICNTLAVAAAAAAAAMPLCCERGAASASPTTPRERKSTFEERATNPATSPPTNTPRYSRVQHHFSVMLCALLWWTHICVCTMPNMNIACSPSMLLPALGAITRNVGATRGDHLLVHNNR